jgi:hypothetical protein
VARISPGTSTSHPTHSYTFVVSLTVHGVSGKERLLFSPHIITVQNCQESSQNITIHNHHMPSRHTTTIHYQPTQSSYIIMAITTRCHHVLSPKTTNITILPPYAITTPYISTLHHEPTKSSHTIAIHYHRAPSPHSTITTLYHQTLSPYTMNPQNQTQSPHTITTHHCHLVSSMSSDAKYTSGCKYTHS